MQEFWVEFEYGPPSSPGAGHANLRVKVPDAVAENDEAIVQYAFQKLCEGHPQGSKLQIFWDSPRVEVSVTPIIRKGEAP